MKRKKPESNAKRYPLCENRRIPFTRNPPVSCLLGRCPNPRRTQKLYSETTDSSSRIAYPSPRRKRQGSVTPSLVLSPQSHGFVGSPSCGCAIFQIADRRASYDKGGKVITKNVLGKTQAEVKEKLRAAIESSKQLDPVKAGSYTLEQWLRLWYSVYVEPQVRYSTKEFYHNAIDHHIIPELGSTKLEKLSMLQIQRFYNELLKAAASRSRTNRSCMTEV